MATLPRFVFPLHNTTTFEHGFDLKTPPRERPHMHLSTVPTEEEGYRLVAPKRPEPLRTSSTPPESPTRLRAYTMGSVDPRAQHNSGAITPPLTPTHPSHAKASSGSSITDSLCSLRRGDSTSSSVGRPRQDTLVDDSEKPGSTELRTFPHWLSDYEIQKDDEGKKRTLGSGLWSDVYLAKPCFTKSLGPGVADQEMTPPITPVHSRNSSLNSTKLPQVPPAYAIKVPAMRSAKKVLGEEARVLSYLSRLPGSDDHIVPFYGQDTRTEALVLKAMDGSLEEWVMDRLNGLEEAVRVHELVKVFPGIARQLLEGLSWMDASGCIHADIKPANILVSKSETTVPHAIYSDFSSSILTTQHPAPKTDDKPPAPLGGGTWDFLDPSLLSSSLPASPSTRTDLWSVAITLLSVIVGSSPFDCAGNKFQRREMVKQGVPLTCATYGDNGPRNLARITSLSDSLGMDMHRWFGKVLNKDVSKRISIADWQGELERAVSRMGSKI